MNKIQKISSNLLYVFNFLILAVPTLVILKWIFIDTITFKNLIIQQESLIQTPEGCVALSSINWTWLTKSIGLIANIVGLLPLFFSLFFLKKIFYNYKTGKIFNTTNARHYTYLGWLFFLDALLAKPISGMLTILAVTLSNSPGHRYISISFGTPNIEAIFCGVLVIVISWVMSEASKLDDEQKLTI